MKKNRILLSLLAFFIVAVTHAQKRYLSGNDIPSEITTYVSDNFPDSQIHKVKEEKEPLKTEYEVKLRPKAELEFDGEFQITEIESKLGVPLETLPAKLQAYLTANYSGEKVKEWKLKTGGQKVKLLNGTKLYFDTEGEYAGKK